MIKKVSLFAFSLVLVFIAEMALSQISVDLKISGSYMNFASSDIIDKDHILIQWNSVISGLQALNNQDLDMDVK